MISIITILQRASLLVQRVMSLNFNLDYILIIKSVTCKPLGEEIRASSWNIDTRNLYPRMKIVFSRNIALSHLFCLLSMCFSCLIPPPHLQLIVRFCIFFIKNIFAGERATAFTQSTRRILHPRGNDENSSRRLT